MIDLWSLAVGCRISVRGDDRIWRVLQPTTDGQWIVAETDWNDEASIVDLVHINDISAIHTD